MDKKAAENHKLYMERLKLYKGYGYDTLKSREFFLKQVSPLYGRILDAGTGKGHMSLALAKAGYSLVSADISREEQKFARLNTAYYGLEDKVDFKIDDIEASNFKNESFDIIVCVCLMHHLKMPLKAVSELFRILKLKGRILLSDFSKEGLDLIAKIHSDEGRVHTATIIGLSKIEAYLGKKSIRFKKIKDKFHEILLIQT